MSIPDTMGTAIADFCNWLAKSENGGIEITQLGSAPQLEIRLGTYVTHGQNHQFRIAGHSVPMRLAHILKLSPDDKLVTVSGTGQSHAAQLPSSPTFTMNHPLSWVVERADIKTDNDQATLRRILADFRGRGGAESASTPQIDSQAWADAFAGLQQAERDALAVNLSQITSVPPGFPSTDIEQFKRILRYFFTYKSDGSWYAKGTVAAGRFPQGVARDYVTENHRELQLTQGHICVVVRASLKMWDNAATDNTVGREVIYRLDDRGANAGDGPRFVPVLMNSAGVRIPQATTQPLYDFGFFYTVNGVGPNFSEAARPRVANDLAALLARFPDDSAGRQTVVDDPEQPIVGSGSDPRLLLMGTIGEGQTLGTLPQGVESAGEGDVRTFSCPVDKLDELASVTGLVELTVAMRLQPTMTKTRTQTNLSTFLTTFSRTAANAGTGVIIGVVDTGFDVGHRAFLDGSNNSRVRAVWDQSGTGGQSPRQRASAADRPNYTGMTYGREYQRGDAGYNNLLVGSPGHGTHVASIAGGSAFASTATAGTGGQAAQNWPGGIAQGAEFVFCATGVTRGFATDVSDGVRWCFEKARAAGKPCVVNISLGVQRHAHDGSDALSRLLTQHVTVAGTSTNTASFRESTMPPSAYRAGRVICASAGNDRWWNNHVVYTISAGQEITIEANMVDQPTANPPRIGRLNVATFWAHGAAGLPVNLEVEVFDPTDWVTEILNRTDPVPRGPSNVPVFDTLDGGTVIGISNGPQRPNQHYNIEVIFANSVSEWNAGRGRRWKIKFKNNGREEVTLHGWEGWQSGILTFTMNQTQATTTHNNHKVGVPGTAIGTISVGALARDPVAAGQPLAIAGFSSPGPLRAVQGRLAVDVAAPGDDIVAARARTTTTGASAQPNTQLVSMGGTSMSSPVVTGFVALLMEQDDTLTTGQVRALLGDTANHTGNPSPNDMGVGRLDIGAVTTALFNQHTD